MHLQASVCECVFDQVLALESATLSASRVSIGMERRNQADAGLELCGPRVVALPLSLT